MRITLLLPLAVAVAALGVGIGLAARSNTPAAHPIAGQSQFVARYQHIKAYHALIGRLGSASTYHAPTSDLAPQPSSLTPPQKAQQRCIAEVDRYNHRAAAIPAATWNRAKLPPQHLDGDTLCI
jgi:hypothetical protein